MLPSHLPGNLKQAILVKESRVLLTRDQRPGGSGDCGESFRTQNIIIRKRWEF